MQHALRAYTPRQRKAVKTAAETFRPNPKLDTAQVISELGVGEALVSTLDRKGRPNIVQHTWIRPPSARLGPAKASERRAAIAASPLAGVYEEAVDRKSAYEVLTARAEKAAAAEELRQKQEAEEKERAAEEKRRAREAKKSRSTGKRRSSRRQSAGEAMLKSAARSIGTQLGRSLIRGILGSLLK